MGVWNATPRWYYGRLRAVGSEWCYGAPQVGDLILRDATATHPGVVRRITSVREDERDGRKLWIVEYTAPDADPTTGTDRKAIGFWANVGWLRMPEHYPICAVCNDLMPCKHTVIDVIAEHSSDLMEKFSTPGVCPSCREPVTARQRSITYDRNMHGIGDVTFHLRKKCIHSAYDYDRAVHADDGHYRLTCPGTAHKGLDEHGLPVTYCSLPDCRGANRKHANYGFWIAAYLPCPEGYHRAPDFGDAS